MDPLSVIQNIISAAQYIKSICDQVKANKQQCQRLSNRIEIILSPVKTFAQNPASIRPENLAALNDLVICLGDCRTVVHDFYSANWAKRAFQNQTDNETFRKLNDRLSASAQQLSLSLDITRVFDREADKKDIEEDLADIESKLNDIIDMHQQTSQQIDNLAQSVDQMRVQILAQLSTKKEEVKQMDTGFKIDVQIINSSSLLIDRMLGKGGIAQVYVARWDSEMVAVKKLNVPQMSQKDLKDFYNEANIMYRTRHPNVVLLQGIVQEPDNYMLVMELMDKGTLLDLLRSTEDLTWSKRFNFAIDIASGMAYLHKNKIIHCDLKSLNILLDRHETCKIGDFGLAKIRLNSTASLASVKIEPVHTVSGIRWKAPELLQPNGKFTKESDVYSFGVILWELSERKIPYAEAATDGEVTKLVIDDKVALEASCPPKFQDMIRNCTDRVPKFRPSFANICGTLDALVRDEPLHPLPVALTGAAALPPLPVAKPVVPMEDNPANRRIKNQKFKEFWINYWGPNTVSVDWADFFDCLSDYLIRGGLREFNEEEIKQQFGIIHGKVSMNSFNTRTQELSSLKELALQKK
ncbi:copper transport protein ctr1 [Boothiomyces macroporosus]|uniref:Copper transport protein ctr1 n=1 Tax=Boothiomyces macroporosus TaxID=261099 RepID=A0AAD5U8M3_9FUNG|nr:copper transport protein ctr1 [Boothiomyces macroporosus]